MCLMIIISKKLVSLITMIHPNPCIQSQRRTVMTGVVIVPSCFMFVIPTSCRFCHNIVSTFEVNLLLAL